MTVPQIQTSKSSCTHTNSRFQKFYLYIQYYSKIIYIYHYRTQSINYYLQYIFSSFFCFIFTVITAPRTQLTQLLRHTATSFGLCPKNWDPKFPLVVQHCSLRLYSWLLLLCGYRPGGRQLLVCWRWLSHRNQERCKAEWCLGSGTLNSRYPGRDR